MRLNNVCGASTRKMSDTSGMVLLFTTLQHIQISLHSLNSSFSCKNLSKIRVILKGNRCWAKWSSLNYIFVSHVEFPDCHFVVCIILMYWIQSFSSLFNLCDWFIGSCKNCVPYIWHKGYCRFCSSEYGDRKSYEPLPTQCSCSYKVRFEDIGRCLRCECIVTDVFGRLTEPVYTETAPVMPGIILLRSSKLTSCTALLLN